VLWGYPGSRRSHRASWGAKRLQNRFETADGSGVAPTSSRGSCACKVPSGGGVTDNLPRGVLYAILRAGHSTGYQGSHVPESARPMPVQAILGALLAISMPQAVRWGTGRSGFRGEGAVQKVPRVEWHASCETLQNGCYQTQKQWKRLLTSILERIPP
jgi:hypothetical protein